MIVKRNVIYQKDRRVRLPEVIESNFKWIGGITNLDIWIEKDRIIIQKSKNNKPNNYSKKEKNEWQSKR